MITWQTWAATHKGLVRGGNEDYYGATGLAPSGDGELVTAGGAGTTALAVVADGLGGHPAGEVASRLVVECVLASEPASADGLVDAIHAANDAVYEAMTGQPEAGGMGSTLAALLATSEGIAVANVGDSAVFELVDGRLIQLTVDDAPAGRSALPGIPSGLLTQTLGGSVSPTPVRPHVYRDTEVGRRRFLLCTDGLTNFVPVGSLTDAIAGRGGREAVKALIGCALKAGGPDNVTVVVMDTDHKPER